MRTSKNEFINRLSRIEGQISALKRTLENGTHADCVRTIIQVKTAANGLKRFAEAFSRSYAKRCIAEKKSPARFANELDAIISSAFTLS